MNRKCPACKLDGIKIGRVVTSGPPTCELCGAEFEVVRYKNLPHLAAAVLALLFLAAWLLDAINFGAFIVLCGVWLALDFLWELLVPLERVDSNK